MTSSHAPLLIAAVTGRALAASALRGGYGVVVLDCFADRDTRALARACRSAAAPGVARLDARGLLAAAAALAPPDRSAGLVYGSGFERRPRLLARLAAGRRLYGNAPAVVAAMKDPRRLFPLLRRLGIRHPETRFTAPGVATGWLIKQRGGAGGAHVRRAGTGRAGDYYQRFERGRSLSALFLADGRRACVIGFNEQWVAAARPTLPFLYGGAVGGITLPPDVARDVRVRLDALVAATGLVGLNGLDFLLRGRPPRWLALEVNPRPTATLQLYDADYPRGLFDWHLRACAGELPQRAARPRAARAHAIVYAPAAGYVSPALAFPRWCRDLPDPGVRFAAGAPVCTVLAAASDAARAAALVRRRQGLLERALVEAAA
jgi:predicted ATP-grasp superfamily ATP-dependent carboligase